MLDGSTTNFLSIYWICGSNTLCLKSSACQQEIFGGRNFCGNNFSQAGVWLRKLRKFLPRENFPLYGISWTHDRHYEYCERVRKTSTNKILGSSWDLNPRPSEYCIIMSNSSFWMLSSSFPDKRTIHILLSRDEVAISTHGNIEFKSLNLKWLTLHIDGGHVRVTMSSSEEWWGHTDIAGVLPGIRYSKWVEGEAKRATSPWCHAPTGVDPCDGGGGGQCSSPSDSGCAGESVGLTSSEGASWRDDGGCDCGYCRRNEKWHAHKNVSKYAHVCVSNWAQLNTLYVHHVIYRDFFNHS